MRFLFVLSASLWAWLVGRTLAFGPTLKGMCWHPMMHADTWYRLTPNPYNIPYQYFAGISYIIAALAIPALFIDNNMIHAITVAWLVSEHAYVPIFVAHVHSEIWLTLWPLANAIIGAACVYLFSFVSSKWATIAVIPTLCSVLLNMWFFVIECHLLCKQNIIRQEQAYEERRPRLV